MKAYTGPRRRSARHLPLPDAGLLGLGGAVASRLLGGGRARAYVGNPGTRAGAPRSPAHPPAHEERHQLVAGGDYQTAGNHQGRDLYLGYPAPLGLRTKSGFILRRRGLGHGGPPKRLPLPYRGIP